MSLRPHHAQRSLPLSLGTAAALACALALLPSPARAIILPPDFALETVPFTFDVPTDIAFLPDGRLLVAEKGGVVYVVDGATRHPMWVHEEEVLNAGDRGLLAIAVDPRFDENRFLYFLFTVDPDSDGVELNNYDDTFGRLVRYEVSASNPDIVDESTRTVLLGATWSDGFASGSESHTIGDLAWGRDGTLLVAAGDGAQFETMDAGGYDPELFADGRTDPFEDVGAFRSQELESKDGKVLRIDAANGHGLPSNPYWDGDPASNRSRVWAYGLRNPFRITIKPGTGATDPSAGDPGTIYLGDVGWQTWEEVDVAPSPGLNFGWPCFEGFLAQPDYQSASPAHADCSTIGTLENPALPTAPVISVSHSDGALSTPPGVVGYTMIGGVFADRAVYPPPYRGGYFIGDFGADWIKVLETDAQNQFVALHDFATEPDGPVGFAPDPVSGDLYYVAIFTGLVHRIRYTGLVSAPPPASPARLALLPPRPNPTRGAAAFTLELPVPARAAFTVYDVTGREVWRAPARDLPAGRSTLVWAGLTTGGTPAGAGVYVATVEADGARVQRRFVTLR